MDASINLKGFDVSYNVTKALQHNGNLNIVSELNKIIITSDGSGGYTVDTSGDLLGITESNSIADLINQTISSDSSYNTWGSDSDTSNNITEDVSNGIFDTSGYSNMGEDPTIQNALSLFINDLILLNLEGAVIDPDYTDITGDKYINEIADVQQAYRDSSYNIYSNDNESSFGGQIHSDISNVTTNGISTLDASSLNTERGIIPDILRQYIIPANDQTGTPITSTGTSLGELLDGDNIRFLLRIKGGDTSTDRFEFTQTNPYNTNITPEYPDGTDATSNCEILSNVGNTFIINPCVFLLKYSISS
jgi:hypothetical protein